MKKILTILLIFMGLAAVFTSGAAAQTFDTSPIYLSREAAVGDRVNYTFLIKNNDQTEHNYSLKILNLQKEYISSLDYNSSTEAHFSLAARSSKKIDLEIKIPESSKAGDISFQAVLKKEEGITKYVPLNIKINKNYQLKIADYPRDLNLISGGNQKFSVTVGNMGSETLKNVKLKFELPKKWLIENIEPKQMDLKAGEKGSFNVNIFVPSSQAAANKKASVTAYNQHSQTKVMIGPITVKKSSNYFLVILALLIIMIIGTIYYFRKFGRR
jgi:uncharacterized membrane protein